jgi:hypothetical protein
MAAFFGVEECNTHCSIGKDIVCLPLSPDGKLDLHCVVSPIKNEDIVFLKHCTPQSSLQIKAVGVVQSNFPIKSDAGVCCLYAATCFMKSTIFWYKGKSSICCRLSINCRKSGKSTMPCSVFQANSTVIWE